MTDDFNLIWFDNYCRVVLYTLQGKTLQSKIWLWDLVASLFMPVKNFIFIHFSVNYKIIIFIPDSKNAEIITQLLINIGDMTNVIQTENLNIRIYFTI